jgi:hypothetical protein
MGYRAALTLTRASVSVNDSVPDELIRRPPLRREVPLGVVPLELERKHDRALMRDDHRRVCARTDRPIDPAQPRPADVTLSSKSPKSPKALNPKSPKALKH